MATAPPTAAPPNFYENLPAGGDAAAGGPAPKAKEKDEDWELIKGAQGMYRVAMKIGEAKKDLKPFIDSIKDDIKNLFVKGLKQDPSALDAGGEKPAPEEAPPAAAENAPPGGQTAPPTSTDESHAA
jgi:hypothetical protein